MRGIAFSRLLTLVVLVPVVGLAIFGGSLIYDSWARYSDLSRASSVLRLALATARFGGIAIPGEGAASREFIGGTGDRARLEAQRRVTDELYRLVREAAAALSIHDAKLDQQIKLLDDRVNAMLALRQKVDAGEIKVAAQSTAVIAPVAAQAIDLLGTSAAAMHDPLLSRRIFEVYTTAQFIENAMVQRGVGEVALREGKLPPDTFGLLSRGVTLNATFGKLLRDYAQPQIYDLYKAFDAANGRELAELRQFALANAGTPASDAQRKRWSEISRDLTAVVGKILVSTVDTVAADGEQMLSEARRSTFVYLGFGLAVLIAVVWLSRKVMHTLRDLLGDLAGAVDKMRDGQYDVAIPHTKRSDEIGVMARATEGFRENFTRVKEQETAEKNAHAAAERKVLLEKIAGDFQAVVGGIVGAVSSSGGSATAGSLTRRTTSSSPRWRLRRWPPRRSVASATRKWWPRHRDQRGAGRPGATGGQPSGDRIASWPGGEYIGDVTLFTSSPTEPLALNAIRPRRRGRGRFRRGGGRSTLASQTARQNNQHRSPRCERRRKC